MRRWIAVAALLCASWAWGAESAASGASELERSRDAGLLTDWRLEGRYGRDRDLTKSFRPEREARKKHKLNFNGYDRVFADGCFVLRAEEQGREGVYYATSLTYVISSGDWNLFLESGAGAVVFVDGEQALLRLAESKGAQRTTLRLAAGYHQVLVKFVAKAAPFRVALLAPASGSKRKHSLPQLFGAPGEVMLARLEAE